MDVICGWVGSHVVAIGALGANQGRNVQNLSSSSFAVAE